ncbi:MAG: hypothetical protein VKM68_07730 [Cyanobacteriota bacterium]|nr:hypothetical protein [Cyanobacteriota bacterium]
MLELSWLGLVFLAAGILLWWSTDSDDDDSSGGLLQPALVPVRVKPRQ